jgi:hypothetical protein
MKRHYQVFPDADRPPMPIASGQVKIQILDTPRRERTGILGSTTGLADAGFRQQQ